jgi:uncharacterized protein (TIGR03435 family)
MRVIAGLCLTLCATAQTFEVASVKPAGPWVPGQKMLIADPGRITFPRASLISLLMHAYDVWIDQIAGPAWINDANTAYTVTATMAPGTTKAQERVMLQNLLAERFGLQFHRESQSRPGYELVVGEGGHKLKAWTEADGGEPEALQFLLPMSGAGRIRIRTRDRMAGVCRVLGQALNISHGVPFGPLAHIVDRTGLDGIYDVDLDFTGVASTHPDGDALDQLASDPGPTLFSAVEKQLGLKLRKTGDVRVAVLVVDRANQIPSEN